MKKSILILAIALVTVLGVSQSAFAGNKEREAVTVLTEISNINKIEVHGNVELYLSDGTTDQVKVYNKYYEQSALVQSQNGVLRISSYAGQKLVVWVKSTDLRAITAYDNAEVRSFGKLSPLDLTVTLNDNAYGKLRVEGYGMNVVLKDRAKADIAGNVEEGTLRYNRSATMNSTEFAATHLVRTIDGVTENRKADEFAGL